MTFDNLCGNGQAWPSATTIVVAWVQTFKHGENRLCVVRRNVGIEVIPHIGFGRGAYYCPMLYEYQ